MFSVYEDRVSGDLVEASRIDEDLIVDLLSNEDDDKYWKAVCEASYGAQLGEYIVDLSVEPFDPRVKIMTAEEFSAAYRGRV